jgi:hypothetical protein
VPSDYSPPQLVYGLIKTVFLHHITTKVIIWTKPASEIGDVLPKPSAVTLKADFSKRLKKAQQEALLGIDSCIIVF